MKNTFLSMLSIILLATAISSIGEKQKADNPADQSEKQSVQKPILAHTPPLGWNSYDRYGITIRYGRNNGITLQPKEELKNFIILKSAQWNGTIWSTMIFMKSIW